MRRLVAIALALPACSQPAPPAPASLPLADLAGPDITLRRATDRVWIHDSLHDQGEPWGVVSANGLIVIGDDGAVLVDTAWTPEQATWLFDRVEAATGKGPLAVFVTHSHEDRSGGIAVALERGIPVHTSRGTADKLPDHRPTHPFDDTARVDIGGSSIEAFYPGAGHTTDNIVVYASADRVLFGGCLIRAASTNNLGYTAEADIAAWPATVARVAERYDNAALVVPGHGAEGTTELLSHTIELAERGAEPAD